MGVKGLFYILIFNHFIIMEELKPYYFTFGVGQGCAGHYVIINAFGPEEARERMNELFPNNWSSMYESAEEAGVERWGYKLLNTFETFHL